MILPAGNIVSLAGKYMLKVSKITLEQCSQTLLYCYFSDFQWSFLQQVESRPLGSKTVSIPVRKIRLELEFYCNAILLAFNSFLPPRILLESCRFIFEVGFRQ